MFYSRIHFLHIFKNLLFIINVTFCLIILLFSYLSFFFSKSVDKFTFFFRSKLCLVLRIIAAL